MLPIGTSTSPFQPPPSIVNTTIPDTSVVRVPYDNVAPTVSGVQVDNNSRGNGNSAPPQQEEETSQSQNASAPTTKTSNNLVELENKSSQASFIAQIASQSASNETQGSTVQTELQAENRANKNRVANNAKPNFIPSGTDQISSGSDISSTSSVEQTLSSNTSNTGINPRSSSANKLEIEAAGVQSGSSSGNSQEESSFVIPPGILAYSTAASRINSLSTVTYTTTEYI